MKRLRRSRRVKSGRSTMAYRVYSGPRGSEPLSALEKDHHLYKECSGSHRGRAQIRLKLELGHYRFCHA
jgi:hypothetical protein